MATPIKFNTNNISFNTLHDDDEIEEVIIAPQKNEGLPTNNLYDSISKSGGIELLTLVPFKNLIHPEPVITTDIKIEAQKNEEIPTNNLNDSISASKGIEKSTVPTNKVDQPMVVSPPSNDSQPTLPKPVITTITIRASGCKESFIHFFKRCCNCFKNNKRE